MQNFSEGPHAPTIRDEGFIYSATGKGRVGFIDAEDIAATAAATLTTTPPLNADVVLTGPEALSYADVAVIISEVAGRPVRHVVLEPATLAARLVAQGLPTDYAHTLAGMDANIAAGAEDCTTSAVEQLTGQRPTSFRDFAKRAFEQRK